MPKQEINIELLLGRRVFDLSGRSIGRLEEVEVELTKERCFVTEFHVGSYAVVERLAAFHVGRALLRLFGATGKKGGCRVAWNQMDYSNPNKLRLNCKLSQLKA